MTIVAVVARRVFDFVEFLEAVVFVLSMDGIVCFALYPSSSRTG